MKRIVFRIGNRHMSHNLNRAKDALSHGETVEFAIPVPVNEAFDLPSSHKLSSIIQRNLRGHGSLIEKPKAVKSELVFSLRPIPPTGDDSAGAGVRNSPRRPKPSLSAVAD